MSVEIYINEYHQVNKTNIAVPEYLIEGQGHVSIIVDMTGERLETHTRILQSKRMIDVDGSKHRIVALCELREEHGGMI